jgi:hypothetical protein
LRATKAAGKERKDRKAGMNLHVKKKETYEEKGSESAGNGEKNNFGVGDGRGRVPSASTFLLIHVTPT